MHCSPEPFSALPEILKERPGTQRIQNSNPRGRHTSKLIKSLKCCIKAQTVCEYSLLLVHFLFWFVVIFFILFLDFQSIIAFLVSPIKSPFWCSFGTHFLFYFCRFCSPVFCFFLVLLPLSHYPCAMVLGLVSQCLCVLLIL